MTFDSYLPFCASPGYGKLKRYAELSPCGLYRYSLHRTWSRGGDGRCVCFVMLNPSTADAQVDDPTVTRCMGFARYWGYSIVSVRNLYAFRATSPKVLRAAIDPIGPLGDISLAAARSADTVVLAWGSHAPLERHLQGLRILKGKPLYCLGVTQGGMPKHPLYLRGDLRPVPFEA